MHLFSLLLFTHWVLHHQIFILSCFVIVLTHMLILGSFWVWFNTWQTGPAGSIAHGDNSSTIWWKDWLFHWSSLYSCQKQSIIHAKATSFVFRLEINGYIFLLNAYKHPSNALQTIFTILLRPSSVPQSLAGVLFMFVGEPRLKKKPLKPCLCFISKVQCCGS